MKIVRPSTEIIEEARKNPGGYVYVIDNKQGPYNDNSEIPPFAIFGAWTVDTNGEITGEFTANPNYRTKDGEKIEIVALLDKKIG